MKQNFKFVVPIYNCEKWIGKNIKSMMLQDYESYECFLIDDMSTDNTVNIIKDLIKGDHRFKLTVNTEKKYALKNIYDTISPSAGFKDEDVIVTLDGDDWLATKKCLSILNDVYNETGCSMTYGSYLDYPSMRRGCCCGEIPDHVVRNNGYREARWVSSHLRTFKYRLWSKIEKKDLLDEDGEFYRMTWDMAFMYPMLEMAGPLAVHIPETIYVYNGENPNNDHKIDKQLQVATEKKIQKKQKYKSNFITAEVAGGLGNQLFRVATVLGYAYENSATPVFPEIRTGSLVRKYKDIFYTNLKAGRIGNLHNVSYNEPRYEFDKVKPVNGSLKIKGYFQSYKYFQKYNEKILKDLNIEHLKSKIRDKYGDFSDYVSIHVRRGDYLGKSDYHHNLKLEYYKKAISNFPTDQKYLIFSDDLEWCKNNFKFLKNVEFSTTQEDWEDMILMSSCRDNIIANSSFSWWGAWLNDNEGKKVIAPKKWFGPKYSFMGTEDLIPKEWVVL